MAILPTGYNVSTTGIAAPTNKLGGVMVGVTSQTNTTSGPITEIFDIAQTAGDSILVRRSLPKATTGAGHAFHAQSADSGGTFAYEATYFIMRGGVTTQINGQANSAIQSNGNESFRRPRWLKQNMLGADTSTSYRAGYWNALGVANQRTNWSTAPTGLAPHTFKSTTSNSTNSDDQGLYVTYRSVPGELVYMQGSLTPKQDDYKAITG